MSAPRTKALAAFVAKLRRQVAEGQAAGKVTFTDSTSLLSFLDAVISGAEEHHEDFVATKFRISQVVGGAPATVHGGTIDWDKEQKP